MLDFHYHPLSPIARRVWLALLEREIPFTPCLVDLKNHENFEPEYLAIHPFHHVPALVDGELKLIESFAILDYLEAKFPARPLSPTPPKAIGQMKMVQLVVANELMPLLPKLVFLASDQGAGDEEVQARLNTVLTFLAEQLAGDYFGGDRLSLADITVGAALPLMRRMGVDLGAYPSLAAWCDRVSARPAWQQTEPSDEELSGWRRWISVMVKRRHRSAA
ncbi:MAG: glutathione S-transferase family protein [Cyanobacteria bacterium P01_F01_bin.153]